jgi:hypothetical protein
MSAKKSKESEIKRASPPQSKKAKRRKSVADPGLVIANPHAAGIDVHSREHWVCVPATSADRTPRAEATGLADRLPL